MEQLQQEHATKQAGLQQQLAQAQAQLSASHQQAGRVRVEGLELRQAPTCPGALGSALPS